MSLSSLAEIYLYPSGCHSARLPFGRKLISHMASYSLYGMHLRGLSSPECNNTETSPMRKPTSKSVPGREEGGLLCKIIGRSDKLASGSAEAKPCQAFAKLYHGR